MNKNKLNILSRSCQNVSPHRSNCGRAVGIDSLEWAGTRARHLCAAPLHLRGLLLISAFQEKVVLLAEVLYTNPQAVSGGRIALPLSLFLPLPSLGLRTCPHVNGFPWLISKDPAAVHRASGDLKTASRPSPASRPRQRSRNPAGIILPSLCLSPLAARGATGLRPPQRALALPASAPQPLSASSSAAIFPPER